MTVPVLRYRMLPTGPLLHGRVLPSVPALEISLRVSGGFIQWRRGEDGAWEDLIATADLTGTPAEILAGLLTVDGAGSGLDADLLDGQDGAFYLARANHTGTQTAATISDFDAEVSNNADVAANTAARHDAVTVTDSAEINFTLTGQDITAALIAGSVDETKLDASVNASLDLADSALQAAAIGVSVQAWDAQLDSLSGASVNGVSLVTAANYAAMRGLLDLEAGTDFYSIAAANAAFQPIDADLTSWAGVTRAAGFDTFTATPSSANLAALVTGETGTGALVFATSPALVTPALGTPSALVLTNATGLTAAGVAASALVTAAEGLASSDNDTSWPTTAAVIDAIAAVAGGTAPNIQIPINLSITPSVSGNALTIALKGADGNDPAAGNPVIIPFRNVTPATGTPSFITVTAANSLVISSGSTLGAPTGSVPFKIWVVGFNDAGTFRLGAILCTTLASGVTVQYPLAAWGIASSLAEGGAGAADAAQTFYTGTAVTSKAYTVLAVLHYESGLATAGTWASAPTRTQLFDPSVPLPGRVVQIARTESRTLQTGTTIIPLDDTIPQNTEGTEFMTRAITPTSAANLLGVQVQAFFASSISNAANVGALFQDSVAGALQAGEFDNSIANFVCELRLDHKMIAATSSSTTFKFRAGPHAAATMSFNGAGGGQRFGGSYNSFMEAVEIAA